MQIHKCNKQNSAARGSLTPKNSSGRETLLPTISSSPFPLHIFPCLLYLSPLHCNCYGFNKSAPQILWGKPPAKIKTECTLSINNPNRQQFSHRNLLIWNIQQTAVTLKNVKAISHPPITLIHLNSENKGHSPPLTTETGKTSDKPPIRKCGTSPLDAHVAISSERATDIPVAAAAEACMVPCAS